MASVAKVRRVLPYLSLAVLAVLIYDAWVFYSRRQATHQVEQERAEKDAADAQRTLEQLGRLKIQNFYVSPPVVERGKSTRLCYSVIDAKTLRVEPPVGDVYPALSHCVEVSPQKDTEYTLTATDEAGHSVSEKAGVRVVARQAKETPR
ncbi:MAG TPA: hypothetical protein VLZ50_10440 [Terracidiphilus sp.]|nr:hypothetical protein [Terracidiphilus sp.]